MPRSFHSFDSARWPARTLLATVSVVLASGAAACKRDQPKPDPDRTAPSPASTVPNPAPTASTRVAPPVEERTPLITKEGERKTLSLVGIRVVEFSLGQQRSDAFDVWNVTPKGGGQKLVVVQGGFTFTQERAGFQAPLTLETKTITGGPVAAAHEIGRLEGVWPDALLVHAEFSSFLGARQHGSSSGDFERADGKWSKVKSLPFSTAVLDDAVLAVEGSKLSAYRGTPTVMPAQAKPPADAGCGAAERHLDAVRIGARTGAGVLLLGTLCQRGAYAVERFAPGRADGAVEVLPGAPKNEPGNGATFAVSVGSATSQAVLVALRDSDYLAVARPGTFRQVTLPLSGRIKRIVATADDALFVLVDPEGKREKVLLRLVADTWTRFGSPSDVGRASVSTLFASDRETAIVGGSASGGDSANAAVLFATFATPLHGKPEDVKNLLKLDKAKAEPAAAASSSAASGEAAPPFPAFEEGCTKPFVFVFDVSKSAPADFSFPSTKKALASFGAIADLKLVEFLHQDKRRLGAYVKDAAMGRALVAHITANMKDEKPLLVCFAPAAERVIPLP